MICLRRNLRVRLVISAKASKGLKDVECPARHDNQRKQTLQSRSAFTEKEPGAGRRGVQRRRSLFEGVSHRLAKKPPWIFIATRLLTECLVLSVVVVMVRERESEHGGNLQFTISCLVALMKHESSIPVLAEGYNRRVFLNVISAQYYIGCFHRACPVFQFCSVGVKEFCFVFLPGVQNNRCCTML